MRNSPPFRAVIPHQPVRHPRVTQPSATRTRRYAFDLQVLGTPPAFTLSQDQTLHHEEFVPFRDVSVSKGIKCKFAAAPISITSPPNDRRFRNGIAAAFAPTEVVFPHLFNVPYFSSGTYIHRS